MSHLRLVDNGGQDRFLREKKVIDGIFNPFLTIAEREVEEAQRNLRLWKMRFAALTVTALVMMVTSRGLGGLAAVVQSEPVRYLRAGGMARTASALLKTGRWDGSLFHRLATIWMRQYQQLSNELLAAQNHYTVIHTQYEMRIAEAWRRHMT